MKKLLLFLTLFVLTFSINAQEEMVMAEYPEKGDSEIGVSLGLFSGYLSDGGFGPTEESDYLQSLGFSVSYDHYFSKTWSIKTRLNYDPKGTEVTGLDAKFKANYITIPVMANWHFGKRKRWYLHFGPYIGVLLSADVNGTDVKEVLKSTDIGFDVGLGVKIPIGSMMFFIESDGQNAFSTPAKDSGGDDSKWARNSLSIGILF